MRRLEEVWSTHRHPLFFVTFCTADRRRWLACEEVLVEFRAFAARSPQKADVWVGRFVLMPDHVHVFVGAEGSPALSRWVGSMKGFLASRRRARGFPGAAWQEGFFDHVLRSSESYDEKWDYVRMNPVRAGLVARPEDWPFAGEIHQLDW